MDRETGICRDFIHGDPQADAGEGDESRGSTGVTGLASRPCALVRKESGFRDRMPKIVCGVPFAATPTARWNVLDVHTGQRWRNSEVSTSDSIWLLAGALTCRQYFHEDSEIKELAALLYSRYDFVWMTNGDGKASCTQLAS